MLEAPAELVVFCLVLRWMRFSENSVFSIVVVLSSRLFSAHCLPGFVLFLLDCLDLHVVIVSYLLPAWICFGSFRLPGSS